MDSMKTRQITFGSFL